jgi:LPXTG-site transpeptidase (sortase) family protein
VTASPDRHGRPYRDPDSRGPSFLRGHLLVTLAAVIGIVIAATVIAIIAGGGFTGPGTALVSPSTSASAGASLTPFATSLPSVGSTPSSTSGIGTRATQIRVPRLRIDLPIIEGDGIDVALGKAAHYPGTAWPGGGSNIYLYAHARDRMFISLWNARRGDEVILRLVDHTERTYVVTQVLPKVPWNAMQYLDPTATEQLTLQTCTSYQPTAPRFIVIAVPKP